MGANPTKRSIPAASGSAVRVEGRVITSAKRVRVIGKDEGGRMKDEKRLTRKAKISMMRV